ncbi:uncharacterized protein LOC129586070 [Paramacrobiotus metropolitanus]|uniref:uncharacterized protein LOC129586070 n=1 Tax=Paramacrobiotus metropolitanus TaxID=2943436 RepID=UPI0024456658|nr:uncharacterized protein LOC129586070 [Paramacrobiotus metropolitanus]
MYKSSRPCLFAIVLLSGATFADPARELEAECSPPTASALSPDSLLSSDNFTFRTDLLTQEECHAYVALKNSTTSLYYPKKKIHSQYIDINIYCPDDGRPGPIPDAPTFIRAWCSYYNRSDTARLTRHIRRISPGRAVLLLFNEGADADDSLHPDVIGPVRDQLLELSITPCVTPHVTAKIHAVGPLPHLVTLELELGRNLVIKKQHFTGMPQVRQITCYNCTIARLHDCTNARLLHWKRTRSPICRSSTSWRWRTDWGGICSDYRKIPVTRYQFY